jgi:hypothetical protein
MILLILVFYMAISGEQINRNLSIIHNQAWKLNKKKEKWKKIEAI